MIEDLEKGDVAETAKTFFEQADGCQPAKNSTLTLADVCQTFEYDQIQQTTVYFFLSCTRLISFWTKWPP